MLRSSAPLDLGPPSERAAVIVRAQLPPALERLRRRSDRYAAEGLPAHLTMLYPFVAPSRLHADVRRTIASVAAATQAFDYRITSAATWPTTIYAAVDPIEPFIELQRRLGEAFPAFPIYGRDPGFEFMPHITIAEGPAIEDRATLEDPAWRALPRSGRVLAIEVIARPANAPWRTIWRVPLGRMRA